MSSATTLSLNEVVSRALPDRIPRAIRTRLRRRIVLLVRRYELDNPFFLEIQKEKITARQEHLIDIAKSAIKKLDSARQKLGCSATFREAADRASHAQHEQSFWGHFSLAKLEELAREAPTERMRNYWLGRAENHKRFEEELKRDSAIGNQLARAGLTNELKGELTLPQSLDLALSRAMTEIRESIKPYYVRRGGDESDVTQLVRELLRLMRGAELTKKEAKALLGILRGVKRLDIPDEEALKKRAQRALKDLRAIRDRAATGKIRANELSQLNEDFLNLKEFAWLADDEITDLDDAFRNVRALAAEPIEAAGEQDAIGPDSVNPVPSRPH